ncbi:RNA binding Pelota-like protein [Psychrobacillus insolitus]|uniref:RNA binding Pelota-like protein n=1 Tax=Psychrobacillus insolitus TaxID=1461 RepID=A0A2W7MFM2_9BACI|nr:cysteine protease StiP family protein [Psychrobacillus insolitus]PZX05643.1 RNA binding Pelota-like protein [Psychrobacillus insolitus]
MVKLNTTELVKSSYPPEDITFLLKDLSNIHIESSIEKREKSFQQGSHYSESLPIEYLPSPEYTEVYQQALKDSADHVALLVGVLTRRVRKFANKDEVVLISLARAGSPIGILMKRYANNFLKLNWPHFSISILRGKGIDEEAVKAIRKLYPNSHLQFVDGWTGKGAIQKELTKSVQKLNDVYQLQLNDDLAVLSDPGECATLFGTRTDFLIPNACLNSTVSGLVSRTILNEQFIKPGDYHGAKYYAELEKDDVSNDFIANISKRFHDQESLINKLAADFPITNERTWRGMREVEFIAKKFYKTADISKVKPSVGETTRVLLRRKPFKILLRDTNKESVQHILQLCREKNIPIEIVPDLFYLAIGLIESEDRL